MTDAGERTLEREDLLYDRLIACLEASGEVRDALRAPIEADFPEFAQELREFFDGERMLERFASPLRLSGSLTPSTVWGQAQPAKAAPTAIPSLSDYELVREIARGGMGVVYEARHKMLGRAVALKTIRAGERATEEDVRRFEEEARRVAQLDHPGIVPLYEAGHEHGQHYFTMRLMEGGSLADRIAAGRLAPRHAAEVASRVARALHFAHQHGILHGDVKPANVLFDKDARPHVGDFGLASQLEPGGAVSRLEAVMGTPMYMAPELVRRDGNLTTGVDVYGLGAVLYELLTGRPPFRARTLLQTLADLAQRDPERPRLIDPSLDPDLEAICLKCLDKDPARRYGSAESLADDLDRWLRGEPVKVRHCPAWRPCGHVGSPLARRRRAWCPLARRNGGVCCRSHYQQRDRHPRNEREVAGPRGKDHGAPRRCASCANESGTSRTCKGWRWRIASCKAARRRAPRSCSLSSHRVCAAWNGTTCSGCATPNGGRSVGRRIRRASPFIRSTAASTSAGECWAARVRWPSLTRRFRVS